MDINFQEFTFEGLCVEPWETSLAYVVGLVDAADHETTSLDTAAYGVAEETGSGMMLNIYGGGKFLQKVNGK
jgi:hypothetical protein